MIEILRVTGWELNKSDKIVNSILRRVELNEGECPCSSNTSEDKHCPCSSYRTGKGCCCGLYKFIPPKERVEVNYSPENIEGD